MKRIVVVLLIVFLATKLIIGQTSSQGEESPVVQSYRPGLINITELNVGFGLGDTDRDFAKRFVGMTSVLGYGITRNLYAGIGAGLSSYNGGMLFPLFFDLRYMINLGKISTYAFVDGGLLFDFHESSERNKIFLNPGLGILFPIGKRFSINLGAGLLMQTTKEKDRDSFLDFKMGITYLFRK